MTRERIWQATKNFWEIGCVLLVASWLRFSTLADPFFITDQGRAFLAGRDILQGNLVLWGPQTSVAGVALGPLYYYWTAAALWMSHYQVWGPTLSVAVANILAIGLLWWWLRKFWGRLAAFTGAGILAVSGLATLQASIALEPAPLPLFVILWLAGISLAILQTTASRGWWIFSWLMIGIAVQLNASAVIFVAVTLTTWWWKTRWSTPYSWVWQAGIFTLATGIFLKTLLTQSTPAWYWWHSWHMFMSPTNIVPALVWSVILTRAACAWLQRKKWPLPITSDQQKLLWILGVWGSWSGLAFSLKTVSGDHALGVLFIWVAAILGIGVQTVTPFAHRKKIAFLLAALFACQALLVHRWIQNFPHPRVSDHYIQVDHIIQAANGEPYAFLYRGHLDIYDAADDHLQYLLWLRGTPPVIAARIDFDPNHPEYCETWLPKIDVSPHKSIVLEAPFGGKPTLSVAPPPQFRCE